MLKDLSSILVDQVRIHQSFPRGPACEEGPPDLWVLSLLSSLTCDMSGTKACDSSDGSATPGKREASSLLCTSPSAQQNNMYTQRARLGVENSQRNRKTNLVIRPGGREGSPFPPWGPGGLAKSRKQGAVTSTVPSPPLEEMGRRGKTQSSSFFRDLREIPSWAHEGDRGRMIPQVRLPV